MGPYSSAVAPPSVAYSLHDRFAAILTIAEQQGPSKLFPEIGWVKGNCCAGNFIKAIAHRSKPHSLGTLLMENYGIFFMAEYRIFPMLGSQVKHGFSSTTRFALQ